MKRGLFLHEEIMLLALRDREGTVAATEAGFVYALGGALLAELLLAGKVGIEEVSRRKKVVVSQNLSPVGEPLLDECLEKLRASRRRGSVSTWVSRFAGLRKLRERAADQLCRRGILRADEKTVLLLFRKKVYPELDPGPERAVVERLREVIFSQGAPVDARTSVLVALAHKAGVLRNVFDQKELKERRKRIEEVAEEEVTSAAVKELLEATQAAIVAAAAAVTVASAAT